MPPLLSSPLRSPRVGTEICPPQEEWAKVALDGAAVMASASKRQCIEHCRYIETQLRTFCIVCGVEWIEDLWRPTTSTVCKHCDRDTCMDCGAPAKPTPLLCVCLVLTLSHLGGLSQVGPKYAKTR